MGSGYAARADANRLEHERMQPVRRFDDEAQATHAGMVDQELDAPAGTEKRSAVRSGRT